MKKFLWISFVIVGMVFGYSLSCVAHEKVTNFSRSTLQSFAKDHFIRVQKTTEDCDDEVDEDCPDNKNTPKPDKKKTPKYV